MTHMTNNTPPVGDVGEALARKVHVERVHELRSQWGYWLTDADFATLTNAVRREGECD